MTNTEELIIDFRRKNTKEIIRIYKENTLKNSSFISEGKALKN
jgi:hypothetical protein